MATQDHGNAYPKTMAAVIERWKAVTPHATNFIESNGTDHNVALCLLSVDGGVINYRDPFDTGTTKTLTFAAGQIIPGKFTRVMASGTTSTEIYAGFIGEPLT